MPTLTVVTAESVPVAATVCVTSPFSTFAVRYFGSDFVRPPSTRNAPTTRATAAPIQTNDFLRITLR